MKPNYLLDTNILSEPLKLIPNTKVLEKLKQYKQQLATASIVIQEMTFGYQRLPHSKRRQKIEEYTQGLIKTMPILPYTLESAIWHGTERARLSQKGLAPTFIDGQIAAISKANNLILVTRNIEDFQNFDIKIENWFK